MPYWPDPESSKEMGPYVVTCTSEMEAADYKVRVLEIVSIHKVTFEHRLLTSLPSLHSVHVLCGASIRTFYFCIHIHFPPLQPNQYRTIWHYQYMSWPDHGVPQEPGGVLSFLTQVNSKQAEHPDAGPMIIHCRYEFKSLNEPGGNTLDCTHLGSKECDSLAYSFQY